MQENTLNANAIYNQCIYNVVEVKAASENIGQNFGTGVIVSSDGRIVTNAHVVTYMQLGTPNEFEKYYIKFSFEDDYREVTLEKYNSELDLAVLKLVYLAKLTINPIKTGNSNQIKSGDKVYAVGNASNYGIGIFERIVSVPLVNIELTVIIKIIVENPYTQKIQMVILLRNNIIVIGNLVLTSSRKMGAA